MIWPILSYVPSIQLIFLKKNCCCCLLGMYIEDRFEFIAPLWTWFSRVAWYFKNRWYGPFKYTLIFSSHYYIVSLNIIVSISSIFNKSFLYNYSKERELKGMTWIHLKLFWPYFWEELKWVSRKTVQKYK